MRVLVAAKWAVDPNVRIRIKDDGSGVDLHDIKMALNPFDEVAVEEAVRLKEAGVAREVVVVSAGTAASEQAVRAALALGADRGILIDTAEPLEALSLAKLLRAVCLREQPRLVLCGRQSVDEATAQTGPMLAALLDWPQAAAVAKVVIEGDHALLQCETDDGSETLEMALPAVVTADLRLNEPRFASLPNILKARKKPLEVITPSALGVSLRPHLRQLSVVQPTQTRSHRVLTDVKELAAVVRTTLSLAGAR